MRIALITLALTALLFIGSIIYSLMGNETLNVGSNTSWGADTPIAIETLKYQIKNEERINELMKKVEAISAAQWGGDLTLGIGQTGTTSTGKIIPLSWKFLSRVMPTLNFTLVDNAGIYDLAFLNTATEYSTYVDAKQGIKAMPITMKYDVFLKNMKALSKDVYTVNETKTFPFRSFYLNPPKTDTLVRLVIEIEWQTIALEIPKTKFGAFKTLMLKN